MRSLGIVQTGGRPLCIALADSIGSWSGYVLITEQLIETNVNEDGVRFAVLQLTVGQCEVLASQVELAIVEILEAPEGYSLENGLMDVEGVFVQPEVIKFSRFGGDVVVFDSGRHGEELEARYAEQPIELEDDEARVLIGLCVDAGRWSASLFEIEQPGLRLKGVWFQLEEAQS